MVEPGIRVLKATLAAESDEADDCRRMVWWGCLEHPLGCESPTRYNVSRETLPEGDPAGDANSAKPTRTAHAADPGNQAGPRRSPRGTLSWEQDCRTGEVRNEQDSPLRKQLQAADMVNRLTSRGLLEPLASSVSRETIQIQSVLLRPLARSGGSDTEVVRAPTTSNGFTKLVRRAIRSVTSPFRGRDSPPLALAIGPLPSLNRFPTGVDVPPTNNETHYL